jgi:CRISPR-associated protein Csd1
LIKLILIRNRKEGGFMPQPQLADTDDAAYNLGRLLAVLENLQNVYHDYEKKGAGIIERYYGTASTAPAAAFPLLCRLARHHFSKVRKENEGAANSIENRLTLILSKFPPSAPGQPPLFPRTLALEEQGKFALGFYQQKAHLRASAYVGSKLKEAYENRANRQKLDDCLKAARDLAQQYGYPDLIERVTNWKPNDKNSEESGSI